MKRIIRSILLAMSLLAIHAGKLNAAFTTYVQDNFNRADTNNIVGSLPNIGTAWLSGGSASFGISSNQLEFMGGGEATPNITTGQTDVYASVDIVTISGARDFGITFRYTDNLNFYLYWSDGNTTRFWKRVAGVFTSLAQTNTVPVAGQNFKLQAVGTTFNGYINNGLVLTVTDSTYTTPTGVGFYAASDSVSNRYDNFLVTGVVNTTMSPLSPYHSNDLSPWMFPFRRP